MIILGIHDAHDASACLMVGGRVVAAAQEERWTGLKGDYGLPLNAIQYCLREAGLHPKSIDRITLNGQSWNPVLTHLKRNANFEPHDWVREQREYFKYVLGIEEALTKKEIEQITEHGVPWDELGTPDYYQIFAKTAKRKGWRLDTTYPMEGLLKYERRGNKAKLPGIRRATIANILGVDESIIKETDHENTHIAYAYFGPRERDRAIVLTAEGCGDYSNSTVSQIYPKGTPVPYPGCYGVERHSHNFDNHIGHIYQYVTLLLGMRPARDEYKVMGLAPYADPQRAYACYDILCDILTVDGLKICIDKQPSDFYFRLRRKFEGYRFDDIAGGLQAWVEDLLGIWAYNCTKELGCKNVVFAGGVAQNIKAVKTMAESSGVDRLTVMPAAGDTSASVGACYYTAWQAGETPHPLQDMYLGPEPNSTWFSVEALKAGYRVKHFKEPGNLPCYVAKLLTEGKIIARCCGRMEFGLRALGNRSIMADPRNLMVVHKLNQAVKKRDFWMPFTPTILDTDAHRYIKNPKGLDARFMTMAFESTEQARQDLPAALHPGDWTVRPQVLTRDDNPDYYDIVAAFKNRTGVGAILNTSLNIHGSPICKGEREALYTFERSDLDGLLVGNVLALKN